MLVTLGRYDTEEEAQADCRKFADQATYRELLVQAITPPPPPAETPPAQPAAVERPAAPRTPRAAGRPKRG